MEQEIYFINASFRHLLRCYICYGSQNLQAIPKCSAATLSGKSRFSRLEILSTLSHHFIRLRQVIGMHHVRLSAVWVHGLSLTGIFWIVNDFFQELKIMFGLH
jgi:hypothetical protein